MSQKLSDTHKELVKYIRWLRRARTSIKKEVQWQKLLPNSHLEAFGVKRINEKVWLEAIDAEIESREDQLWAPFKKDVNNLDSLE